MLVQAKTLGLTPIKCENREGTEALKKIHYAINDVLYVNAGKYLFKPQAEKMYETLVNYGKELKDLEVPEKAQPKKNEILAELRTRCNSLKVYKQNNQVSEDVPEMQRAVNWTIHLWIEAKDSMTPEKALELLRESKTVHDLVWPWSEDLKLSELVKMNHKLVSYLEGEFQL